MLNILGSRVRTCSAVGRRQMLQAFGAGLFGTSLSSVLAAEAARAVAESCFDSDKVLTRLIDEALGSTESR